MKRWVVVTLSVVGVLALVAGLGAWWLLSPARAVPYDDPVSLEARESNTAAAYALAGMGIANYTVDTDATRILLVYEPPVDADADAREALQRAALAAGAEAAPDATYAVAVQVVDGQAVATWTLATADYRAFAAGALAAEELETRIVKA